MGVSVSMVSRHYGIHAFSRQLPTDDGPMLDVAVVWEGPTPRTPAPDPRAPAEPLPPPDGWNGSVDQGGPREVLHSARRRVVRVAGREHPLPTADATLVLLVRDAGTVAPIVRPRLLTPAVRFDDASRMPKVGFLRRLFGDPLRTIPWLAALMRDPEIAAVLDPRRRGAA